MRYAGDISRGKAASVFSLQSFPGGQGQANKFVSEVAAG